MNIEELIKKYENQLNNQKDTIERIKIGEFKVNDDIHVGKASAYQEILQDLKELKKSIKNNAYNMEFKNLDIKMKVVLLKDLGVDTDE